jgi:hypothetical protein
MVDHAGAQQHAGGDAASEDGGHDGGGERSLHGLRMSSPRLNLI